MKELKRVRRTFLAAGFLMVAFWAAVVFLGRLPDSLEAEGIIEAGAVYPVTPAVTGILEVLHRKEGDRIVKGELIAEFEKRSFSEKARDAALEVDRWELEISRIESEIRAQERSRETWRALAAVKYQIAEAKFNRSKSLLDRKKKCKEDAVVPLTEYEQAETDFKVASENMNLERLEERRREQEYEDLLAGKEAERSQALLVLEQARLDLEKARADLEACRLVAPVSGTIMHLDFRPGDLLERGIRLTTIVRDADLRFTAFVDDEDMAFMRSGLPVEVSMDAFPHRKYGIFSGRVEAVAPGADPGGPAPLFRVTVALEEKGKQVCLGEEEAEVFLRPGQKGRARIILREAMPVWNLLFDRASAHL